MRAVERLHTPGIEAAAQPETKFSRPANPLIYPLDIYNHSPREHFAFIVNGVVDRYGGGSSIGIPFIDSVEMSKNQWSMFVALQIPLETYDQKTRGNLRSLLRDHFQMDYLREGTLPSTIMPWAAKTPYFSPYPQGNEYKSPDQVSGFLVRGKAPSLTLELRYNNESRWGAPFTEVEFSYLAVISSLIIAGGIDLSSPEGITKSLDLRRSIFMDIYQMMLGEYQPPVAREEICGLDEQITDVEQNLYDPLTNKGGTPMNTLLVGAPGVGKTFVSRFFATRRDVVTIPVSIDELVHAFDHYLLPTIRRVTGGLGFPTVLAVEDIERLLERAISVDTDGKTSQVIDPAERSKALNLLERMQDTHEIYLMASLNHPDVEAAFLRRFNHVYFPLPSAEQREFMLRKIISQGPLKGDAYNAFVNESAANTEGFNYSGLSLVPQYTRNFSLGRDGNLTSEEYLAMLGEALEKSRQRTSLQNLAQFDQSARTMIGLL